MTNYYILLTRITSLEIKKEDVKDYLEHCDIFNENPHPLEFLDFIGSRYSFDFDEDIDYTDVDDSSQFYELIKEIREEND